MKDKIIYCPQAGVVWKKSDMETYSAVINPYIKPTIKKDSCYYEIIIKVFPKGKEQNNEALLVIHDISRHPINILLRQYAEGGEAFICSLTNKKIIRDIFKIEKVMLDEEKKEFYYNVYFLDREAYSQDTYGR